MVISLKKYTKQIIPEALQSTISAYKFSFNPSYVECNNLYYFSIRLFNEVKNEIIAMVYIWDKNQNITSINLTKYFKNKENLIRVADPKLFILNNTVHCTFNTGFSFKDNNTIVLLEIANKSIVKYAFCNYRSRTRVEKNWAFYTTNNKLYCVYSLYPLIILRANKVSENNIEFVEFFNNKEQENLNCTIGTPMLKIKDELIFIAHKKISKNGKRVYIGKPFSIKLTKTPQLVSKNVFLYHSIKSILGSKHKFNKNLFSCTYFSGISKKNDSICLGYGVNDVSWNTVLIGKKKLWH